MKKIFIFIIILVVTILLVPVLGNKVVKQTLNSKIEVLKLNGMLVKNTTENSTYLNSFRHYEFLLSDMDKFLKYLSKYSDKQFPTYTSSLLKGTLFGVDIKYSNIPFSKAIEIEIYPMAFSDGIMNDLKKDDLNFYTYLKDFLARKGILYHINYNVITQNFDGFIRNIDEKYTTKDSINILIKVQNTSFRGEGSLLAPNILKVNSKSINLNFAKLSELIKLDISDFYSTSNFYSHSTYLTSAKVQSLKLEIKESSLDDVFVDISKMNLNISSNTQGKKVELNARNSFEVMNLKSGNLDVKALNFNQDIAAFGIDKDLYEELRVLVSKAKVIDSDELTLRLRSSFIKLLSSGLKIYIADLSLKDLEINNSKLDGFKLQSKMKVKADKNLSNVTMLNLVSIANNVDVEYNLRVSKKIFLKLLESYPILVLSQGYAKEDANDLIFESEK